MNRRTQSRLLSASLIGFLVLGWVAISLGQELTSPTADQGQEPPAAHAKAAVASPPAEHEPAPAETRHPIEQQSAHEPQASPAPEQREELSHEQIMQECQRLCRECAQLCNRSSWYAYRLGQASGSPMAVVQQLSGDCQSFCELAGRMMERRSPLMAVACGACEQACRTCEQACEDALQKGGAERHRLIAECAAKCRQCAESCKKMVDTMTEEGLEHHAGQAALP